MYSRISLIVGTFGRTQRLEAFLDSIEAQRTRAVEVIIIDQNDDARLADILDRPYDFDLVVRKSMIGLSRARNLGLKICSGDIIGFPDDDCVYPGGTLQEILDRFNKCPDLDGLCGRICSLEDQKNLWRFAKRADYINRYNLWRRSASASMFFTREMITRVGLFNEDLGLGSGTPWGAGEESDFLLRALRLGGRIFYTPKLIVLHPPVIGCHDEKAIARAYSYGCGIGKVLRKHWGWSPFVLMHYVRPVVGLTLSLISGKFTKSKFYYFSLKGKVRGFTD